MSEQNTIQDAAVEAAKAAVRAHAHVDLGAEHLIEGMVRAALEAAVPYIRADVWDEGHDAGFYARERWVPLGVSRDASESDARNPYRPTP